MTMLKNRKTAVMISVIVMAASLLFAVHKSLNKLAGDISLMFYDGVLLKTEGYTERSIADLLENQLNYTLGAATIAANYPELADDAHSLLTARGMLGNAFSTGKISDIYKSSKEMQAAFVNLIQKSQSLALSERDATALKSYSSDFTGAQSAIDSSSYNTEVKTFQNGTSYSAFAYMLKPLAFVKNPQTFAG